MAWCGVLACYGSAVLDSQYLYDDMSVPRHGMFVYGEGKSTDKYKK